MARLQPRDRVGLVGTGMVGASFAYSLMQSGLANELILIDADAARAEGEAMDLSHGLPFVGPMRIRAGGYELLTGCDLVVITAGANQRPGQTRLDLLQTNAAVIRDVVPRVVAANPTGVILVAIEPGGHPDPDRRRPRGLSAGPRLRIGNHPRHGTVALPAGRALRGRIPRAFMLTLSASTATASWPSGAWRPSRAFVSPILSAPTASAGTTPRSTGSSSARANAAYEIIQRKRSTYYAIGLGLRTIVEAVLRDQHTVLTVSARR